GTARTGRHHVSGDDPAGRQPCRVVYGRDLPCGGHWRDRAARWHRADVRPDGVRGRGVAHALARAAGRRGYLPASGRVSDQPPAAATQAALPGTYRAQSEVTSSVVLPYVPLR